MELGVGGFDITIIFCHAGRFLSKSGSSEDISLSWSSSGNETNPPKGKALNE